MTSVTLAELDRREALGHTRIVVVVPRKTEPRGPNPRVRIAPFVFGTMVGWRDGEAVVDVAIADLRRHLSEVQR